MINPIPPIKTLPYKTLQTIQRKSTSRPQVNISQKLLQQMKTTDNSMLAAFPQLPDKFTGTKLNVLA